MENADLKYIKKHYGEQMAHLCRELFPTILEYRGLLPMILEKKFAHSSSLAEDIISEDKQGKFKAFILSMIDENIKPIDIEQTKPPKELLDEAGYILYPECKTEEDIQSFKHYYAKGEELCTFKGGRLDSCRVWFAVKKNVDQIKRKDFKNPERQDEYGTSVISIQFSKERSSWLSIKNRYNHTVANPDATFSNDLDNIIPGLSSAFSETYNIDIVDMGPISFELNNYVLAGDGKFYRYNQEIDNTYYCENNVIINNGTPKQLDPARYIVMDYFVVDMAKKSQSIKTADKHDSFIQSIGKILSISIETDEDKNRVVRFKVKDGEDVLITLNKQNEIIKYDNRNIVTLVDDFLYANIALEEINIPSVKTIANNVLGANKSLKRLILPNVTTIGKYFVGRGGELQEVYAPKLESVESAFLCFNETLKRIELPLLTKTGESFLSRNEIIEYVNLPELISVDDGFMDCNFALKELNLPLLKVAGKYFLFHNSYLTKLELPNLEIVDDGFLYMNNRLKRLVLPKLKTVKSNFLYKNESLKSLKLPELSYIGNDALARHPEASAILKRLKINTIDLQK
ncbi:MAG: leucine-rich repeat protein [Clostridia bacterium]|nr:leucine-rich repeat protein [Clostridia bacterium]